MDVNQVKIKLNDRFSNDFNIEKLEDFNDGMIFLASAKDHKRVPSKVVVAVSNDGKIGESIFSIEEAIKRMK